jgi:hypothetical protein
MVVLPQSGLRGVLMWPSYWYKVCGDACSGCRLTVHIRHHRAWEFVDVDICASNLKEKLISPVVCLVCRWAFSSWAHDLQLFSSATASGTLSPFASARSYPFFCFGFSSNYSEVPLLHSPFALLSQLFSSSVRSSEDPPEPHFRLPCGPVRFLMLPNLLCSRDTLVVNIPLRNSLAPTSSLVRSMSSSRYSTIQFGGRSGIPRHVLPPYCTLTGKGDLIVVAHWFLYSRVGNFADPINQAKVCQSGRRKKLRKG